MGSGGLVELAQQAADAPTRENLNQLAEASRPLVERSLRSWLRDPEEIGDFCQNVLVRVFLSLRERQLNDPSRYIVWLHRIVRSCLVDEYRRRQRSFDQVSLSDTALEHLLPPCWDAVPRPELHAALGKLSRKRRRTLLLHDVLGYSVQEIMSFTPHTTEDAVRQQLRRARQDMRSFLRTAAGSR